MRLKRESKKHGKKMLDGAKHQQSLKGQKERKKKMDKDKLKEKTGYKPDGSLKENKKMIGIFLAIILIPLFIGMIAVAQGGGWE